MARTCVCIHVHACLSSLVCTNVSVCVCVEDFLSQHVWLVCLRPQAWLAVSGGSESFGHVCRAQPRENGGDQQLTQFLRSPSDAQDS